ncbi:MAG: branched-chain amino acid ABC transporter substrate-binding protein, partial [Billgrantia desiderata]
MSTLPRAFRWLALGGLALGLGWSPLVPADTPASIVVGYLGMERPDDQEPLSVLDPVIDDEGLQGARLGLNDNNATAQFLGQEFVLHEAVVAQGGDVGEALESLVEQGVEWIVSGLPAAALNEVMAHPARGGRVVFNAWAPD